MNEKKILNEIIKTTKSISGEVEVIREYDTDLNSVYLVRSNDEKYIVKIATCEARVVELNHEIKLLKKLLSAIRVPKVIESGQNEQVAWVVMEFIEGKKIEGFNNATLKKLGQTLRSLHDSQRHEDIDYSFLLNKARRNMVDGRLDKDEFYIDGKHIKPSELLDWLDNNRPAGIKAKLLHGDFRPKNIIKKSDGIYLIDFGLSFFGDEYYDLAVFRYYLSDVKFKFFCKIYGIETIDEERFKYNEVLSKFLNV